MARVMDEATRVAHVKDAGGRVVGRTRLQKIAYILEAAGLESGFAFSYKHYGPYSEELANAARAAVLYDLIDEVQDQAAWGGTYSIFNLKRNLDWASDDRRGQIAREGANADAVQLELAATALFLKLEGIPD